MTSRTFLLVALPCLLLAAASLVLADALDAPALAVFGCAAVLAVVAARESWQWRGRGRQWLASVSLIVMVVAIAFLVSLLIN